MILKNPFNSHSLLARISIWTIVHHDFLAARIRIYVWTASALLTLLAMFLAGAFHTGETARACLFIMPFERAVAAEEEALGRGGLTLALRPRWFLRWHRTGQKSEDIAARFMNRVMPEVEKIRQARGEGIYEYMSGELVPSLSKNFTNYTMNLHQQQ